MSCTWCGLGHPSFEHGGLQRRARWWDGPHPFRPPRDTPGVTVTLTDNEIERATKRAQKIVTEDQERGYAMYFAPGGGESRLDVNIRGFGGEIAASRVTGLKLDWRYLPKTYRRQDKPPDMGRRTEVRAARSKTGRLWASTTDPVSNVFLLVVGTMPTFTVCGWIEGSDLLVAERWEEPPTVRSAGYFADRLDLNDLPLPDDA